MSYAFQSGEAAGEAIVRIMREQIVRARASLTDTEAPLEKRIHDARKRFKETRAVLRLVRKPLGAQFSVENASYRDAGRQLSESRDADAVIESLAKLSKHVKLSRATKQRVRLFLEARRDAITPHAMSAQIESVLHQLTLAEQRLVQWPPMRDSFGTIAAGLRRTYRDGRRMMRTALASGMPADFHEWRKRVKEHWYHAQLLRHMWPEMMKPYAAVLETLSRTLGDHHDLTVLRGIVAANASQLGRATSVLALLDAIHTRQSELEREAEAIGSRVYAEPARDWLARMRSQWTAWRAS